MNEVLTTPEASPDSLGLDVAHGRQQQRVERDAGAEAEQQHARAARRSTKLPSTGARANSTSPSGGQQQARPTSGRRDAEAHHELGREAERERAHDQVGRQEGEPDLRAGCSRAPAACRARRGRTRRTSPPPRGCRRRWRWPRCAAGTGRSGISGDAHARLDDEETASSTAAAPSRPSVCAERPAGVVAVDDRVDGEHQRGGHGDRAADVECAPAPARRLAGQQRQAERVDHDADRQVDEEDPVPVERSVSTPPSSTPIAAAAGSDEAEDAHRLGPLGRLGEQGHDQRQRDRRDDRAAEALHGARGDQQRPASCARPQASDASVNSAMPARNSRRWPNRSPSRPPSSRKPPKVSR